MAEVNTSQEVDNQTASADRQTDVFQALQTGLSTPDTCLEKDDKERDSKLGLGTPPNVTETVGKSTDGDPHEVLSGLGAASSTPSNVSIVAHTGTTAPGTHLHEDDTHHMARTQQDTQKYVQASFSTQGTLAETICTATGGGHHNCCDGSNAEPIRTDSDVMIGWNVDLSVQRKGGTLSNHNMISSSCDEDAGSMQTEVRHSEMRGGIDTNELSPDCSVSVEGGKRHIQETRDFWSNDAMSSLSHGDSELLATTSKSEKVDRTEKDEELSLSGFRTRQPDKDTRGGHCIWDENEECQTTSKKIETRKRLEISYSDPVLYRSKQTHVDSQSIRSLSSSHIEVHKSYTHGSKHRKKKEHSEITNTTKMHHFKTKNLLCEETPTPKNFSKTEELDETECDNSLSSLPLTSIDLPCMESLQTVSAQQQDICTDKVARRPHRHGRDCTLVSTDFGLLPSMSACTVSGGMMQELGHVAEGQNWHSVHNAEPSQSIKPTRSSSCQSTNPTTSSVCQSITTTEFSSCQSPKPSDTRSCKICDVCKIALGSSHHGAHQRFDPTIVEGQCTCFQRDGVPSGPLPLSCFENKDKVKTVGQNCRIGTVNKDGSLKEDPLNGSDELADNVCFTGDKISGKENTSKLYITAQNAPVDSFLCAEVGKPYTRDCKDDMSATSSSTGTEDGFSDTDISKNLGTFKDSKTKKRKSCIIQKTSNVEGATKTGNCSRLPDLSSNAFIKSTRSQDITETRSDGARRLGNQRNAIYQDKTQEMYKTANQPQRTAEKQTMSQLDRVAAKQLVPRIMANTYNISFKKTIPRDVDKPKPKSLHTPKSEMKPRCSRATKSHCRPTTRIGDGASSKAGNKQRPLHVKVQVPPATTVTFRQKAGVARGVLDHTNSCNVSDTDDCDTMHDQGQGTAMKLYFDDSGGPRGQAKNRKKSRALRNPYGRASLSKWRNFNMGHKVKTETAQASNFIGEYLYELWKNQYLCDVRIRTRNKSFLAHKIVLAAFSDVFSPSEPLPSPVIQVDIPDFSSNAVYQILQYLYTSEMEITDDTLDEILSAALVLGVTDVVDLIKQILMNPSKENVQNYLEIADRVQIPVSMADSPRIFREFLQNIWDSSVFKNVSVDTMRDLLCDQEVMVESEADLIIALSKWAEADLPNRVCDLPALLKHINFVCIPPATLACTVDLFPHVFSNTECQTILAEVYKSFAMSTMGKCWAQEPSQDDLLDECSSTPTQSSQESIKANQMKYPRNEQPKWGEKKLMCQLECHTNPDTSKTLKCIGKQFKQPNPICRNGKPVVTENQTTQVSRSGSLNPSQTGLEEESFDVHEDLTSNSVDVGAEYLKDFQEWEHYDEELPDVQLVRVTNPSVYSTRKSQLARPDMELPEDEEEDMPEMDNLMGEDYLDMNEDEYYADADDDLGEDYDDREVGSEDDEFEDDDWADSNQQNSYMVSSLDGRNRSESSSKHGIEAIAKLKHAVSSDLEMQMAKQKRIKGSKSGYIRQSSLPPSGRHNLATVAKPGLNVNVNTVGRQGLVQMSQDRGKGIGSKRNKSSRDSASVDGTPVGRMHHEKIPSVNDTRGAQQASRHGRKHGTGKARVLETLKHRPENCYLSKEMAEQEVNLHTLYESMCKEDDADHYFQKSPHPETDERTGLKKRSSKKT